MEHILSKHSKQIINSGAQRLHFGCLFALRGCNFVVILNLGAPFVVSEGHVGTIARFYVAFLMNCAALCLPIGAQGAQGCRREVPKGSQGGLKKTKNVQKTKTTTP